MARLPGSVPSVVQSRVQVRIEGVSEAFAARILGQKGRRMLISVPVGRAPAGSWAKPGSSLEIRLPGPNGASRPAFAATVRERKLKPIPLLVVEALHDIPLVQQDARRTEQRAALIATTSGKGGTGKTTFSVNLAWHAASQGLRTALLDADIGTANASLHFGLSPSGHIGTVLEGKAPLEEIAVPVTSRLTLFPGLVGQGASADPSPWQFGRLVGAIEDQLASWDLFIVDTGAGVHDRVTNLLLTADRTVVVTQDDPASYLGAYSLIKRLVAQRTAGSISLLVNRAPNPSASRDALASFVSSVERMLGGPIQFLGVVPDDPAAGQSLVQGRPLVAFHPRSPAAVAYREAANLLLEGVVSA